MGAGCLGDFQDFSPGSPVLVALLLAAFRGRWPLDGGRSGLSPSSFVPLPLPGGHGGPFVLEEDERWFQGRVDRLHNWFREVDGRGLREEGTMVGGMVKEAARRIASSWPRIPCWSRAPWLSGWGNFWGQAVPGTVICSGQPSWRVELCGATFGHQAGLGVLCKLGFQGAYEKDEDAAQSGWRSFQDRCSSGPRWHLHWRMGGLWRFEVGGSPLVLSPGDKKELPMAVLERRAFQDHCGSGVVGRHDSSDGFQEGCKVVESQRKVFYYGLYRQLFQLVRGRQVPLDQVPGELSSNGVGSPTRWHGGSVEPPMDSSRTEWGGRWSVKRKVWQVQWEEEDRSGFGEDGLPSHPVLGRGCRKVRRGDQTEEGFKREVGSGEENASGREAKDEATLVILKRGERIHQGRTIHEKWAAHVRIKV